jgi:hypothetical protein
VVHSSNKHEVVFPEPQTREVKLWTLPDEIKKVWTDVKRVEMSELRTVLKKVTLALCIYIYLYCSSTRLTSSSTACRSVSWQ